MLQYMAENRVLKPSENKWTATAASTIQKCILSLVIDVYTDCQIVDFVILIS